MNFLNNLYVVDGTVTLQLENIQANRGVIKAAQLKGTVAPEHAAFWF